MGKHTFVVSCDMTYLFGLAATINAARFYGTDARFCIAYHESIPADLRIKLSAEFDILWYPMSELLKKVVIKGKNNPNPFWLAPWILGEQIIDEYGSICILQADEFLLNNVNIYFEIAEKLDVVVAAEYTINPTEFEDLPFGTDKSIWDRGQYAIFDQLVFLNKKYKQILTESYMVQCEDPWKGEADHPMCGLNQACCKYLTKDKVLGLDAHTWCWDRDEWSFRIEWDAKNNKLFNERKIRMNGLHTRPWQQGLVQSAVDKVKESGDARALDIGTHNFNLEKDLQVWFNSMTPVTKQLEYFAGRYE